MKIKLLNYQNKESWINIPDNTDRVDIKIISGDMVMVYPLFFDTGEGSRVFHFYDGSETIYKEDFKKLNELTNKFDLFDINDSF